MLRVSATGAAAPGEYPVSEYAGFVAKFSTARKIHSQFRQ